MNELTRLRRFLPLLVLVLGVLIASAPAAQAMTPCERTAHRAFRACMIDTNEELQLAHANCINLGDAVARETCRENAAEAQAESREECADIREARTALCAVLDEHRYDPDPLLDPDNTFVHPDDVPGMHDANPLLSLEAGRLRVVGSEDEVVVILTTDETREINGVECRIVAELAMEIEEDEEDGEIEYLPVEQTFDYYAQTVTGDIVYCGENTVEFEDEFPTTTDGTFIAGEEHAKAGYIIRRWPGSGDADRQEFFLDDAEDYVVYQDLAATPSDDFGGEVDGYECAGSCVQTLESSPLDAGVIEFKYYLPGVGFVLAVPFEENDAEELEWTGEREALLCTGTSLEILTDGTCDVDDGEELLRALCANAGDWFCEDED